MAAPDAPPVYDKPSQVFLREIEGLCRTYGFSLEHEDSHGAFLVVPFN